MDKDEQNVVVSYEVISNSMGILTVGIFCDNLLVLKVAGKSEIIVAKLRRIFH